jgi:hypothetical protein
MFALAFVWGIIAFIGLVLMGVRSTDATAEKPFTPADARFHIAVSVAWPAFLAAGIMCGAYYFGRWLVSDLLPKPKPRKVDERAGYRDSATKEEG